MGTALAFSIYLDDSECKDSITGSLIARLKEENSGTYVANDAAYSKDEGLKEKFFLRGSYLIAALLISCILIGYALNVFVDKIGYKIRILRGLGASRKQMLLLALAESILVILTGLLLGCAAGSAGGAVLVFLCRALLQRDISFVCDAAKIGECLAGISLIFLLGLLMYTENMMSMPLTASVRKDSHRMDPKKMASVRKLQQVTPFRFALRNMKMHRGERSLRMGLSVLALSVLIPSFTLFQEEKKEYNLRRSMVSNNYLYFSNVLTDGVSTEMIEELEKIPGVVSVEKGKFLNASDYAPDQIRIIFPRWTGNAYIDTYRECVMSGIADEPERADYLPVIEIRGTAPGDVLQIETPWGTGEIQVGGIIYDYVEPWREPIIVGNRFLDSLFEEDTSGLYNSLTIHSYPGANYSETDWAVEEVFLSNGMEDVLTNERVIFTEIAEQAAAELFRTSMILLAAGLFLVLVLYQQTLEYREQEKRKIGIFRSLGMSKGKMLQVYVCQGILEHAAILATSLLLSGFWYLYHLRMQTSFDSWYALKKAISQQQELLHSYENALWITIILWLAAYLVIVYPALVRLVKGKIIGNICES